jgi:signal transduction histidine kinase
VKRRPELLSSAALAVVLRSALEERRYVSLLVVRVPGLHGLRLERACASAFVTAARRLTRRGDALGHDRRSDWFAVAMLAPARGGSWPALLDARAVLERIAATISLSVGRRMETGWWAMTQEREVDELSRTMARALERGARERERYEFLATVGHELRTPLTSIRGYLETLLDGGMDAKTSRRFLEVARSEALRLGRIVDGMLDFSLLDLSEGPNPRAATRVLEALHAAADALAPLARDAGISIVVEEAQELVARVDADACMHALVNLVENGIKYGRRGGRVRLSAAAEGAWVDVVVDDDGPGVDPREREAIFEHGVRGSGAIAGGAGIGLSVVRTIAERAAGSVRVAPSPLGGARFVLRFPSGLSEPGEDAFPAAAS